MKALIVFLFLAFASSAFGAWSAVGTIANVNSITGGAANWAPVTSAQLDAGNVGVCVIASDELGAGTTDGDNNQILSVADAAGHNWTKAGEHCEMANSTVANGACTDIWYVKATSNLASGAAITITYMDVTPTAKAMTCMEFTVTAGSTISEASGENGAVYAADPGALTVATGVNSEHLFIRGSASQTDDDTYVADSDYTGFAGQGLNSTADPGSDSVSMSARAEYRIATESTSAVSDPTYTGFTSSAYMIGLNEIVNSNRRIIISRTKNTTERLAK